MFWISFISVAHCNFQGFFVNLDVGGFFLKGKAKYNREQPSADTVKIYAKSKLTKKYPSLVPGTEPQFLASSQQAINKVNESATPAEVKAYVAGYKANPFNNPIFQDTRNITILEDFPPKIPLITISRKTGKTDDSARLSQLKNEYKPIGDRFDLTDSFSPVQKEEALSGMRAMNQVFRDAQDVVNAADAKINEDPPKDPLPNYPIDLSPANRTDVPNVDNPPSAYDTYAVSYPNEDGTNSQKKWVTLAGEAPAKKLGPLFGIRIGYLKGLAGHAFAGAEVFAMKPSMKINYSLKVPNFSNNFGQVNMKTGMTYGFSVLAGKALNRAFALYARTGMEFTDFKIDIDNSTDLPARPLKEAPESYKVTLKPIFVGTGAMFSFGKYVLRAEYNFLTYAEKSFRGFDTKGPDSRRRGYAFSGSGHRVTLGLMVLFGSGI